ncbi:MAG: ATP-dependent DNA helicase RecG [Pseudomonadota bacterium]|nr:ATP-dependent DNA helicase RecG [Pseudomonadota bacterium]
MRPESLYFLFSPVTRLKGIGGATAKALERLLPPATVAAGGAVPIVRDVLFHLPVGIVDRRFTCPLSAVPEGVVATFVVTVDEHQPPKRRGKTPYKVLCSNDTGDITLIFFHASEDYLLSALPAGQKRIISGRCEHFDYRLQMPHPDIIAPVEKLAEVQTVEPVYPLTAGITSRRIASIVAGALEKLPELPEWSESAQKEKWPAWKEALRQVHHPASEEDLSPESPPRLRLACDEMLANQLHLAMRRRHMRQQAGEIIKGTGEYTEALIQSLPFALTQGQHKALREIYEDMATGRRMGRLLQGDVGSGKTIVALLAMLRAAEQGLQAALMAPTELIAMQHYEVISKLVQNIPPAGAVCLLTGSVKGREREEVLAGIAGGKTSLIIGTHALFQEHVEFKNLALAVIDEQHRFGVSQRTALTAKGNAPHVLHMSATPIPRSLAMTIYGDMDISQLTEKPAGRQAIATRVIPLARYQEVVERMKAALERGEKAYWICPLIEESWNVERDAWQEDNHAATFHDDLAAAKSRFAKFRARFGPVAGLVHGRMKAEARDEAMRDFASGKTRLLVATTVVEVGVDVRDATIMVVEHAERFGLSQLHQLRGRVGRGDKPSACVLLYDERIQGEENSPNPSLVRLSVLRETGDGFRIAEEDLKLRGGGDLLGLRQSGLPRFIFTDLFRHRELLQQARDDMRRFLQVDPELASGRGKALKLLLQLFGVEASKG